MYEPVPELVTLYQTQGTDHDIPGYQFLKDGYIAHISTADLTLTILVDGVPFVYVIPNSGGLYAKSYILFALANSGQCLKGKIFTYGLASNEGFRLFKRDSEVRVHAWNGGTIQVAHPFGDLHRASGAVI